jgi:hypothetical protein
MGLNAEYWLALGSESSKNKAEVGAGELRASSLEERKRVEEVKTFLRQRCWRTLS